MRTNGRIRELLGTTCLNDIEYGHRVIWPLLDYLGVPLEARRPQFQIENPESITGGQRVRGRLKGEEISIVPGPSAGNGDGEDGLASLVPTLSPFYSKDLATSTCNSNRIVQRSLPRKRSIPVTRLKSNGPNRSAEAHVRFRDRRDRIQWGHTHHYYRASPFANAHRFRLGTVVAITLEPGAF